MAAIQFFFELTSPYSYIASLKIDRIAAVAGRTVDWRPIELGQVWKAHGVLDAYMQIRALKAPYIFRDALRTAKMDGIVMVAPQTKTVTPDTLLAKLSYWGLYQNDPYRARHFLRLVFHRYFATGKGIGTLQDLVHAAEETGLTEKDLETAAALPGARQAQDASNRDAVASGCFGVPWFVADGERFFGQDRVQQLAEHLRNQTVA